MSQSKLDSFRRRALEAREVTLVGPLARQFPEARGPVLGVDGGSHKSVPSSYDYTLGDGDSLSSGQPLDWLFPQEKDSSDLGLAMQALPAAALTLHLHGFWGGRFDHQMMNLGEGFQRLGQHLGKLVFYTDSEYQVWGLAAGKHQLELQGIFSLFTLAPTRFSITGACRYPLPQADIPPFSSRLLSNEGQGLVEITADQPFFCYLRAP